MPAVCHSIATSGVLHPELRVEVFYDAVERLVVPRLVRHGLDGTRAWSERYHQLATPMG